MLGIYQGRLSYSKKKLQCFPKDPFKEFEIAANTKYDFIEFFSEEDYSKTNPIWSLEGINKYKKFSKLNNIKIYSFCDNYYIKNNLALKHSITYFLKIIKKIRTLKIKKYIIPLYKKSHINSSNKKKMIKNLSYISDICTNYNIDLLVESNMSPKFFNLIKSEIKKKNLYFLFDVGNRVVLKRNISKDLISFGNKIKHIHLKDKNIFNKNVIIGRGLVDFDLFFSQLKIINYKGSYTVESQRGQNIVNQAYKNSCFFKSLLRKYKL